MEKAFFEVFFDYKVKIRTNREESDCEVFKAHFFGEKHF